VWTRGRRQCGRPFRAENFNSANGYIEEYNSSGNDLGVFASGLYTPDALAFEEAIPEPSTWAMVGGGLIALFCLKRHRA